MHLRFYNLIVAAGLIAASTVACGSNDPTELADHSDGSNNILLGAVEPDPGACPDQGKPLTVEALSIDGDILSVTVSFPGGCADHTVTACWIDTGFGASDPPQAALSLSHEAYGDSCEALMNQTFTFDLSPMRERFDGDSGTIVVTLWPHDQSVEYVF